MRIVIVGGGMVGLMLARMLRARGAEPLVLERSAPGRIPPRPFLLGFPGFPALEDAGLLAEIRGEGWDIAPRPTGEPVGICVEYARAVRIIGRDVPVAHERRVIGLLRDGERVTGARAEGPDGAYDVPADLVVACDGTRSPVRAMAGLGAEVTPLPIAQLAFLSPAVIDRSFAMTYLPGGGQLGLLGWPQGSGGWRTIEKVGREAALAPGVAAFRRHFAALLPEAEPALAGVTSMDQVQYVEPALLSVPRWTAPGVVLIGDAAHFFGPETGIGAALGMGDAQALAMAVAAHPDDPDAACADYVRWREPAVRPYEANDPARALPAEMPLPPDRERWPPV